MKQPEIEIFENGKSWGIRKVVTCTWLRDYLYCIKVEFAGTEMIMYNFEKTGEFISSGGNLKGKIK